MYRRRKDVAKKVNVAPKKKPNVSSKMRRMARRSYYTLSKLPERLDDEQTTEEYLPNWSEYTKNYNFLEYDFPGVDDRLPENLYITVENINILNKNSESEESEEENPLDFALQSKDYGDYIQTGYSQIFLWDKANDTKPIGELTFEANQVYKTIQVRHGEIRLEDREKGYYQYLRRYLMDIADNFGYEVNTEVDPVIDPFYLSGMSDEEFWYIKDKRTKFLKDFYASFGSSKNTKISGDFIERKPHE